ncbi:MAG: thiopurine S-methyltransferase [Reyranella sp.]|nr:thiopurine S-methyltransferase [Reyranella sp.]
MDESFWHRKWERNEIAFHEREANPWLAIYFRNLSLAEGSCVFLPLCGKTLDIHWLLSQGYRVAGAELSRIAVEQLFADLGVAPTIAALGQLSRYSANNIDIFVGDIFNLSSGMLGDVDAIYDRAALVALPTPLRERYAAHLIEITDQAPQLLISYDYDQRLIDGPPFAVNDEEVGRHYRESYDLKRLASADIKGGLKGKCAAAEHVWLLKRKHA